MLIGYARVSTADQSLDLQCDALKHVGCKKVFTDVASGTRAERRGLAAALAFAREGDTLVVWKLDRFGRSLSHLLETVSALHARKVGFRSLQENLDTTTSSGKLIFHLFGALAEFERDLIRERTNAGLCAARARGRKGGRPPALRGEKLALAQSLMSDPKNSPRAICATLGISRSTLYRHVHVEKTPVGSTTKRTPEPPHPTRKARSRGTTPESTPATTKKKKMPTKGQGSLRNRAKTTPKTLRHSP